jgi:hypothetical protein
MATAQKQKHKMGQKRRVVRSWDKEEIRALKTHSKAKTPISKVARQLKRSEGALRQQAFKLGIGLGHRR